MSGGDRAARLHEAAGRVGRRLLAAGGGAGRRRAAAAGWVVWPSLVFAAALGSLGRGARRGGRSRPESDASRLDRRVRAGRPRRRRRAHDAGDEHRPSCCRRVRPLLSRPTRPSRTCSASSSPTTAIDAGGAHRHLDRRDRVGGGLLWAGRLRVEPVPPASFSSAAPSRPSADRAGRPSSRSSSRSSSPRSTPATTTCDRRVTYAEYAREGFAQLLARRGADAGRDRPPPRAGRA